ncbi:MAG: hypothetical protein CL766_06725 [Chloroflexi bacterium]|nr:hypothetical protein [Chloroflexota bacterium]
MATNSDQKLIFDDLDFNKILNQSSRFIKIGAIVFFLIISILILNYIRMIYTDYLWYEQLGFQSILLKEVFTKLILIFSGWFIASSFLGINIYFANKISNGPIEYDVDGSILNLYKKITFWVYLVIILLFGLIAGLILSGSWLEILMFFNFQEFNELDPVFGRDISFYVFQLPVFHIIQGWVLTISILSLIITGAVYLINSVIRGVKFEMNSSNWVQISLILAFIMFILSIGNFLSRWDIPLTEGGLVDGALYTDVNIKKTGLLVLSIVGIIISCILLANIYIKNNKIVFGSIISWFVLLTIVTILLPMSIQRFVVRPAEYVKEAEYISRNIEFTKKAFGLNNIENIFLPIDDNTISQQTIAENSETINNIRLWDHKPLLSVYKQIQLIRPYYDFIDADVDRYEINSKSSQVLLSPREVAPEKLTEDARTWINQKLVYTHGIGFAMSPVTDFTLEGRPQFYAKDIPNNGLIPVKDHSNKNSEEEFVVSNPRIYYGENDYPYSIVNTKTKELDYQTDEGDLFRVNYWGSGGVVLDSTFKKLLYALEFRDLNILISGEITNKSLIQYRRSLKERISQIVPFLTLDADPYIVADKENLIWIQDAYTSSDKYPYSQYETYIEDDSINYIRNSVKVTVNAFEGDVNFYLWDEQDPIVLTYQKVFPDLFTSKSDISNHMKKHTRYPQDLFTLQAKIYSKYHMENTQNFYNDEDLWEFSKEKFGNKDDLKEVAPYYVIMKLPGQDSTEFVQLIPYTPNQRKNLIGWLAARSDGENFGKLLSFSFPKDRQIDGTEQVEARIDNDQDISAWFSLRCVEGSSCIRGNLLVVPLGGSILYAEPIYIQAEGVDFPELKKVILASGEKVVMEDSLELALEALLGISDINEIKALENTNENNLNEKYLDITEVDVKEMTEIINNLKDILGELENKLDLFKNKVD